MNFLAHFYLDWHKADSYFVVGAATPDLLSIYNSGLRIKAGHVDHLSAERRDHVSPSFFNGLLRHFHADRVFHSSPLFSQETSRFTRMLEHAFADEEVPRKYFISHIMLELLLDKVLINHHPTLLPDYYQHFEDLRPYVELAQFTEEVASHPLHNYDHFLMKFTDNQYLYHYKDHEHLIYILKRLLRRVGIEQSGFLEDRRFLGLMQDFEPHIERVYEDFFVEIREAEG